MQTVTELPLIGGGGEPVDFARTIVSHGVAELPPNHLDLAARTLETTLPVSRGARTVRITASGNTLRIEGSADPKLTTTVAHMFRLDEDLSRFYALVRDDELAWCALGAGRMLRGPDGVRGRGQDDLHDEHRVVRHAQDDRGARRASRHRRTGRRTHVSDG